MTICMYHKYETKEKGHVINDLKSSQPLHHKLKSTPAHNVITLTAILIH